MGFEPTAPVRAERLAMFLVERMALGLFAVTPAQSCTATEIRLGAILWVEEKSIEVKR